MIKDRRIFYGFLAIFLIFFVPMILQSCEQKKQQNLAEKLYGGKHKLRRISTYEKHESNSSSSGGFFVILGGYSSQSSSTDELIVKFAWLNNYGEYQLSELPIKKIRVKIDSTITEPYVTFNYEYNTWKEIDNELYLIQYMTVYCKEEDFPYKFDLNDF